MDKQQYEGVVLIPRSGEDSGFGVAERLAGTFVKAESVFSTPFDFAQRYDFYIADPTFLEVEKNLSFFVRHFKDSIFKEDFFSIVYNFDLGNLGLIIQELRCINLKITVLVIVKNQDSVPEIEGVDTYTVHASDSCYPDVLARLGA